MSNPTFCLAYSGIYTSIRGCERSTRVYPGDDQYLRACRRVGNKMCIL